MKTYGKRVLYLLLALALTASLLGTTAFAEEGMPFAETNDYVLSLNNYAYFSPFVPLLTYDGDDVYGYSILFGLENTETGERLENAYCTDMPVDAVVGAKYRRLNLTDSTYAASHADKLRAIVLGSYPYTSLDTLKKDSGVTDLTVCEAITGTQLAIWKTAHGDIVQIKDFLYTANAGYNSGHSEPTDTERSNYISGDDAYKAAVKARIEALYNYLMALQPQAASVTAISEASFTSHATKPTVTENEDGTYDVTITTTVNIPADSNVTLTAYLAEGAYYAQTALRIGSGSYALTIPKVPAEYVQDTVTLSIDGTQAVGADVFLLDAEGVRGASQSMIAPLNHTLPVHAEVKAEPDRVLEIHKTADGTALQNIAFEVYYVGSVDDYRAGKLNIGASPTEADIANYAKTNNLVGTITTDADGCGSLNFSTADGVYLVRELPNNAVSGRVAFFVSLPDWSRCDENGDPAYTITASPKNTLVTESVDIDKSVTAIGTKSDTFDVGENHTWIIQSSIPKTIATGKAYTVTDTLDHRLRYQSLDKVELASTKEENTTEPLLLTKDTHYTVSKGTTTDSDGRTVDTFTVSLTAAGMTKIGNEVGSNAADYELRIYFTAQINTSAAMGVNIPNQAKVEYTNGVYRTYTDTSNQPEVYTGGARLMKVDADTDSALSGATFEVYRMAGADERSAPNAKEFIIGQTAYIMIPVSFYANEDMSGGKVTELTTGEDGEGYIYGLAYGDYYLVETKAPDGYNKLAEPTKFTVDATSHTEDKAITVENTTGFALPETGGVGTRWFMLGGLALMIGACAVALGRKKERA